MPALITIRSTDFSRIGGKVAFCLDPGLRVAGDYKTESSEVKSWSQLTTKQKIYATIYSADFKKLNIYYTDYSQGYARRSMPQDDNVDYIIKQLLFWAFEAHNDIFSIS